MELVAKLPMSDDGHITINAAPLIDSGLIINPYPITFQTDWHKTDQQIVNVYMINHRPFMRRFRKLNLMQVFVTLEENPNPKIWKKYGYKLFGKSFMESPFVSVATVAGNKIEIPLATSAFGGIEFFRKDNTIAFEIFHHASDCE